MLRRMQLVSGFDVMKSEWDERQTRFAINPKQILQLISKLKDAMMSRILPFIDFLFKMLMLTFLFCFRSSVLGREKVGHKDVITKEKQFSCEEAWRNIDYKRGAVTCEMFYEHVGTAVALKFIPRCNDVILLDGTSWILIYIQISFLFFAFRCRTSKEGNLESPEMDPNDGEYWSNGSHQRVIKFDCCE